MATVHGCGGAAPDVVGRLAEFVRCERSTALQIALFSGEPPPEAFHSPVPGVDYCALTSQLDWAVLHRDPWVVQPGTTQGRSFQVLYFTCDRSSWDHLSRLDAGARLIET